MRQRMLNKVTINVPDVDLYTVSDIEVTFEQRSSDSEFTYTGDNVEIAGSHVLIVTVPKENAMKLDNKTIRGQVMFMLDGVPMATEIFSTSVAELLKEEGYGD